MPATMTDDIERLLAIETLMLKATSGPNDTEIIFANIERRLFEVAGRTFKARAARGLARALSIHASGGTPAQVATAIAAKMKGWAGDLRSAIIAGTRQSYVEGKRQILLRAHGLIPPLSPDRPKLTEPRITAKAPKEFSLVPNFELEDEKAIQQLIDGQLHWIGEYYDTQLAQEIDIVIRENMLEVGLGRADAGKLLEAALQAKLGVDGITVPAKWVGTTARYFELLASNAVTNGRVRGSLRQMIEVGITVYEIVAVGDERTCKRCRHMDGRTMTVTRAQSKLDAIASAETPEDVKRAHPWANKLEDMKGREGDFAFPPFHGTCRCTVDIVADIVETV